MEGEEEHDDYEDDDDNDSNDNDQSVSLCLTIEPPLRLALQKDTSQAYLTGCKR